MGARNKKKEKKMERNNRARGLIRSESKVVIEDKFEAR